VDLKGISELTLSSFVSVLISIGAVTCVYLFFLNRVLIQLRGARHKSWLIRVGGLVSLGIGAALGYLAAGTPWLLLPIAVLLITALGELQRWLIRWRCRGAAPVEGENVGVSWRKPNTTTDFALARYAVNVLSWRGPALRIAHVSDLHLNSHLPLAYYERVMRRVGDAQPDLIFLTGDFVTDPQYVNLLPGILGLARGRLGTFGVLGNHDYWADSAAVAETVGATGVTLLRDAAVRVPVGEGRHILIAGCESPWSSPPPPPIARPAPGELALLLTHTPDNVYRLSWLGYEAIFAGHYHGGQIRIPRLGSLVVPSKYGRRFDHGHFVVNNTHLFVTAGVGSAEPPLRLWCQPDVFIVDVVGQHG
jgi:predicted MPP superfamily phosphohydrolase